MEECTDALIAYFEVELPKLDMSYQWTIPKIEGFAHSGEKGYEPNVKLKKYFNHLWKKAARDEDEQLRLAKVIVADWGGVKGNKTDTLKRYVEELNNGIPATPLKGVASYSKIFSIVDPNEYAIYDARVAACLNAVQWNAGVKRGMAFNYISGRNKVTGDATQKRGFAHQAPFKVKSLVANDWQRIKRDDTYQVYLDLLKRSLVYFTEYDMHDLEMVLFANAEKECEKALSIYQLS